MARHIITEMESQRVVVVVEEADAARTAVQWAVGHLIRDGDSITLLHVCPSTRSKIKQRNLRRKGFELALSFKDLCNGIAEAKVEIVVMEGDQGESILSVVNKVRASILVVGLHDQSFLYNFRAAVPNFSTRVFAIKQHYSAPRDGLEFSQVEITRLRTSKPKIGFSICSFVFGMLWRLHIMCRMTKPYP